MIVSQNAKCLKTAERQWDWQSILAFLYPVVLFLSLLIPGSLKTGPVAWSATRLIVLFYTFYTVFRLFRRGLSKWFRSTGLPARFMLIILSLWLVYGCASLLWTIDRAGALRELLNLAFALMIVLTCVLLLEREKDLNRLFLALQILTVLMTVLMFAESWTGWHLPLSRYAYPPGHELYRLIRIPTGVSYNENDQAFLLLLLAMIPLAYLTRAIAGKYRTKTIRLLVMAYALIILTAIQILMWITGARIASSAFCLAVFVAWMLLMHNHRKLRLSILALSLILILAAILMAVFHVPPVDQWISRLLQSPDSSILTRCRLIREGVRQCLVTWGRGVGANGFKDHIVDLAATDQFINPHAWLIEILAQYGVAILLLYLAALYLLVRNALKADRQNRSLPSLFAVLLITAFLPGSFGPSQLLLYWPQWLMLGVAFASGNCKKTTERKDADA